MIFYTKQNERFYYSFVLKETAAPEIRLVSPRCYVDQAASEKATLMGEFLNDAIYTLDKVHEFKKLLLCQSSTLDPKDLCFYGSQGHAEIADDRVIISFEPFDLEISFEKDEVLKPLESWEIFMNILNTLTCGKMIIQDDNSGLLSK